MADWKTKVLLTDLHRAYEEGELTAKQVGERLAERLEKSLYREDLHDLISELRAVDDADSYDWCLEQLYDFGDHDHRIWFEGF